MGCTGSDHNLVGKSHDFHLDKMGATLADAWVSIFTTLFVDL